MINSKYRKRQYKAKKINLKVKIKTILKKSSK